MAEGIESEKSVVPVQLSFTISTDKISLEEPKRSDKAEVEVKPQTRQPPSRTEGSGGPYTHADATSKKYD